MKLGISLVEAGWMNNRIAFKGHGKRRTKTLV